MRNPAQTDAYNLKCMRQLFTQPPTYCVPHHWRLFNKNTPNKNSVVTAANHKSRSWPKTHLLQKPATLTMRALHLGTRFPPQIQPTSLHPIAPCTFAALPAHVVLLRHCSKAVRRMTILCSCKLKRICISCHPATSQPMLLNASHRMLICATHAKADLIIFCASLTHSSPYILYIRSLSLCIAPPTNHPLTLTSHPQPAPTPTRTHLKTTI